MLILSLLYAAEGGKSRCGVFITRAHARWSHPAAPRLTLFTRRKAAMRRIDVTATITNLSAACSEAGGQIISNATFDVLAVRRDAGAARQVVLPYFNVVVQGGSQVVAKRVGQVVLSFPAGSYRAQTRGQAIVRVSRAAATLPAEVREILTRRRKAGDEAAAIDPLTDPTVRAAVARATSSIWSGSR